MSTGDTLITCVRDQSRRGQKPAARRCAPLARLGRLRVRSQHRDENEKTSSKNARRTGERCSHQESAAKSSKKEKRDSCVPPLVCGGCSGECSLQNAFRLKFKLEKLSLSRDYFLCCVYVREVIIERCVSRTANKSAPTRNAARGTQ